MNEKTDKTQGTKKIPRKKIRRFQLALMFAGAVFLVLVTTLFILAVGLFALQQIGVPVFQDSSRFPLFWLAVASLLIGTLIAFPLSRLPLKPVRAVCEAADQIAKGDYSVRLDLKGPEEFVQLSSSFNHMAEELGSVEMLRSDFINNFSHEFKTPIVSIRGFARMLKRDDLTPEERAEYLDTIIAESERLAGLSTNILNLGKVERQAILTDVKQVNVSEQLRLVIASLAGKWQEKQLSFDFDCGEIYLSANEEMLRQVWINLLDNAIKFSPAGETIAIRIRRTVSSVILTISNKCCAPITQENLNHIFDKFYHREQLPCRIPFGDGNCAGAQIKDLSTSYQADRSHARSGYGLGLAIVKRIIELHGGTISAEANGEDGIAFRIEI